MKALLLSAAFLLTSIVVGQAVPATLLESAMSKNVAEKRAALRTLHNYRGEEVLIIARGVLDRETNAVTGEMAESLFLAAYRDLQARGELPADRYYDEDAVLGRWMAETYIRAETIPLTVRKNLIRSLASVIYYPELTETEVFRPFVCGTGMPSRNSLDLLAKWEPAFLREMLLSPKSNKAVLLPVYASHDAAGARELAPKLLNDSSARVRADALWTSARLKSQVDPAVLQKLTKDPMPRVRYELLEFLCGYDPKVARPIVTAMLSDSNLIIRKTAEVALEHFDK
ncbi:MAG: HEAT repeat domain-containing protein [Fimbriimonas sp.]